MYHNIKRKRLGSYHGEYTKFPTTNKQTTKNTHNGPTWTLTSQNAPSHVVPTNPNLTPTFKAYIQSQNITYNSQNFPILTQNKPCIYLGIYLTPSLKWSLQKEITLKKVKQQSQLLTNSPTNLTQKFEILNTIIKSRIAYAYYAVPFSKLDIQKLDKIISKLTKDICNIPKVLPTFSPTSPPKKLWH